MKASITTAWIMGEDPTLFEATITAHADAPTEEMTAIRGLYLSGRPVKVTFEEIVE